MRPSKEALARCDEDVEVTKLPVLIWIHGGGYINGAATSPEFGMSRHDWIMSLIADSRDETRKVLSS